MSVMNLISIRLKVIIAFAVVLACTIGLGVFAIVRLNEVRAAASDVGTGSLPSTRILGELSYHTMRFRQLEATYLVAPDHAAKAQESASMSRVGGDAAKSLQEFQPLIGAGEERRLADRMYQQWEAYLALDKKFLALSDPAAAVTAYRGDMRTLFNQFQDALQAVIAFNRQEAKDAVDLATLLGNSAQQWILITLGLAALFCAGMGLLIITGISRPIAIIVKSMLRLAENDTDVEVYGLGRGDEIGSMAKAVEVFKRNAIERARLTAEQKAVEKRATQAKHDALMGMAQNVERESTVALERIGARTTAMAAAAAEMAESAGRTGASAGEAANAATQALTNAQTVASAAEQLSASIREIGGQVGQSTAIVGRAVEAGSQTRQTIETLNNKVAQIGAVADIIGEIAAKTNLLALNATIEAARAGDAGKGFAVVASEVKALATQTARSTEEIGRHIAEVRSATGESVASVARIEETISEMNSIANTIAAAVEEQGAATAEIARNVTETAVASNEVSKRIKEVSMEAERTGERAGSVLDDTKVLNTAVEEFQHSVNRAVRTSTGDVDRRQERRLTVDLAGRLSGAGHDSRHVRVTDVSDHGACIFGGEMTVGAYGTLACDALGAPLPFKVHAVVDGALHVEFELNDTAKSGLRSALERLVPSQAA